jgi:predicted DNA-binding transcriptional regulator AlpA
MGGAALSVEVHRMATQSVRKAVSAEAPADPMRIMKRAEVAALFGVSRVRVDQIAAKGILRKVRLPGLSRSLGFVEAEVRELLLKRQGVK